MREGVAPGSAVVAWRRSVDGPAREAAWGRAGRDELFTASPWRTFRWHDGQQHYSGMYWSATESGHIIYESRLELARLLLADFDRSVTRIVAQPFLLTVPVDGKVRRHIPDYLLLSDAGPVVVDVKPRERLNRPTVAFTFEWTRRLVEEQGWRYEVAGEPDPTVLENVRFLAGYRRDWLFSDELVTHLRSGVFDGMTFERACTAFDRWAAPQVRATILHLMWKQWFVVDLDTPLRSSSLLLRGGAA